MKLNGKFLGGQGVQNKKPSVWGVGYFLEQHNVVDPHIFLKASECYQTVYRKLSKILSFYRVATALTSLLRSSCY